MSSMENTALMLWLSSATGVEMGSGTITNTVYVSLSSVRGRYVVALAGSGYRSPSRERKGIANRLWQNH